MAGTETEQASLPVESRISAVVYNSRQAVPGSLFVAIRGGKSDGNEFVSDAIARGAQAIVSAGPRPEHVSSDVIWIRVPDARKALAIIAANFYGRPADKLALAGITGTNGKTTVSFLVDSILRAAGRQCGLFGTIAHRTPLATRPAETTTPQSLELQRFLAEVVAGDGTHAVLEASSHALALDRLWGCRFAVAIFTNLTRDHLDFHGTFEEYFAAKRRLFEGTGAGAPAVAVINTDDDSGKRLAGLVPRTITYGLASQPDVTTRKFSLTANGLDFTADTPIGKLEIRSQLVGRGNLYNLLAAVAAGIGLGIRREDIEAGIRGLAVVPGRFERVDEGQPFLVVVDYAHTDDALRNLLVTARELTAGGSGRIITLFGCGGDRDRGKRPLMGEAAGRMSDIVVLTSDNPRSEDPLLIINDTLVGLQRTPAKFFVEPHRARAIEIAVEQARPGDIVLIAGKGHETSQVLKDRTIPFDDREEARRILRLRGYGS